MIICCSARALSRMEEALYRRIGKKDRTPLIIKDKDEATHLFDIIGKDPVDHSLVWYFDIDTIPVGGGDTEPKGICEVGFFYNPTFKTACIINSMDDTDFCHIGSVAKRGLSVIYDDCYITPAAARFCSDKTAALSKELLDAYRDKQGKPLGVSSIEWPEPTIVLPNSDRSASAGMRNVKDVFNCNMFGTPNPVLSAEFVNRPASYRINDEVVKFKDTGKYELPRIRLRNGLDAMMGKHDIPAAVVRIELTEDHYYYRNDQQTTIPDPRPSICYRDVVIPLDAPLSWVHQVIQRVFYWFDYHLHVFKPLDFAARELLDDAFEYLFDIQDSFTQRTDPNRFDSSDGEAAFVEATGLSLKWLYGDFCMAMKQEEVLDDDFPQAKLPESMPLGLALLGSNTYEKVISSGKVPSADACSLHALYYNYDFGDNWELSLSVRELVKEDARELPRITGAAGHTPPEDCGGLGGYKDFLKAVQNKEPNEESEDMIAWGRSNGWRPFVSFDALQNRFREMSTWGHA